MKPRSFSEQVEFQTLLSSDARWRGLEFTHSICPPIGEIRVGVAASSDLLLTKAGRSEVKWRDTGKDYRKTWTTGTLTYLEEGYELRDLSSVGAQENFRLCISPTTIERWTGTDPAAGALLTRSLPRHIVDHDAHLLYLVHAIAEEIRNGCPSGALYAESICLTTVSYFWARFGRSGNLREVNGLSPMKLKRLKDYMHANLSADLGLEDFARLAGMSPKHMSRCFKEASGQSPYQYFLGLRIEESKKLLRHDEASVTDIASALGFASPSHFSTAFRKVTGDTPSNYRSSA